MVCVPCLVIPLVLWIFHKFIQPLVLKFWNPWATKSITEVSGPPPGVTEDNTHYKFIMKMITDHPVMVFSKRACSFCKMAKEQLDKMEVEYMVEEIDGRDDCNDLQDMFAKMTGERTVPRIFVGKKCIGGSSEMWSLHNQGKLLPMMKEAGATFKNKKSD